MDDYTIIAQVQDVTDRKVGSQLVNAVAVNDTTIQVVNPWEFNLDDGQLQIGSDIYSFTVPEYLALEAPQNDTSVPAPAAGEEDPVDDELSYSGVLNIDPPAVNAYDADTPVYVYPNITERWAIVREPGTGEDMEARVSTAMHPYLPKNARAQGQGEIVVLEHNGLDLVLTDLYGDLPTIEDSAITTSQNTDDYGWDVLKHGIAKWYPNLQDQTANMQKLITAVDARGFGARILFPPAPIYRIDGPVNLTQNRTYNIAGSGIGWRTNNGRLTVIQRKGTVAVDTPIINLVADGGADNKRGLLQLEDLQFDGQKDAGITGGALLILSKMQELYMKRVRLYNTDGYGLIGNQLYNSEIDHMRASSCGSLTADATSGYDKAAVHIGAVSDGGTNTLVGLDWQFEGNYATDLRIADLTASPGGSNEISIAGLKFEGGVGVAKPYLHIINSGLMDIQGLQIYNHRAVPPIKIEMTVAASTGDERPIIMNGWIDHAPSIANPDYFIEVLGGSLIFHGSIRGDPNIAFIHIGPNVRPGAVQFSGMTWAPASAGGGPSTAPLVHDERTTP